MPIVTIVAVIIQRNMKESTDNGYTEVRYYGLVNAAHIWNYFATEVFSIPIRSKEEMIIEAPLR